MIFLYIYIVLSILSVIHGIISGIKAKYSKRYPYRKWYYEIYASLAIPLFPLIIVYSIYKLITVNLYYEYSTYKRRRTNR